MNRRIFRVLIVAATLLLAGGLLNVSAQTVSGSIANGKVTRGKAARATVVLTLPSELHTNSNKPGSEYAIPTTVKATASGVKIGAVRYPAGHNRKFEFSETPLNVYEGSVKFTFDVTVPASYRGKSVSVKTAVRYQACTNEVCYPPKTKELTLTAKVL